MLRFLQVSGCILESDYCFRVFRVQNSLYLRYNFVNLGIQPQKYFAVNAVR